MVRHGRFLVTKEQIPDFFIWIYWALPFSWVMRALAQNEFRAVRNPYT
jgi:hypothetical protein